MSKGKGVKLAEDIGALDAAIKIIQREWGADCPDKDENLYLEGGCWSCKAAEAIMILRRTIENLKEDAVLSKNK